MKKEQIRKKGIVFFKPNTDAFQEMPLAQNGVSA